VQDSGVGMDAVTASRIFEPFFSTKPRGHGLGLGSCLGIIKAHGGAMLVQSAPGRGSAFSVLLPATELRSTPAAGAKAQGPSLSCHLLVIDDQAPVRSHVRRVLEKDGFVVTEAIGGIAGLAAVQQNEPDVVLLDMMMPDLNGVEVVRRLRASGSKVPVVLFSGDLDAATERGLETGHGPEHTTEAVRARLAARRHRTGPPQGSTLRAPGTTSSGPWALARRVAAARCVFDLEVEVCILTSEVHFRSGPRWGAPAGAHSTTPVSASFRPSRDLPWLNRTLRLESTARVNTSGVHVGGSCVHSLS
jgi:CheY-like chemotaxis protein